MPVRPLTWKATACSAEARTFRETFLNITKEALMDISPDWTHEERLRIIGILATEIKRAAQFPMAPALSARLQALAQAVAWESRDVLDQRRAQIVRELDHIA